MADDARCTGTAAGKDTEAGTATEDFPGSAGAPFPPPGTLRAGTSTDR
ncbi:hypothetical protein M877_04080 [Streptomyces niveus NCIMB 11891]|nr:hypothetical protein M877_04080 [Streptomyces niveus NCIMB 11891]